MINPVLDSTQYVVDNARHVKINPARIDEIAGLWAKDSLAVPDWESPAAIPGKTKDTIDFMLLGDSINFAYTDFDSKIKFATEYQGKEWRGAYGMWACLKRAHDSNVPILEGEYLANVTKKEMQDIFKGNIEIPMLDERTAIFNEVGRALTFCFEGHFYNMVEEADNLLFRQRPKLGLVDLLTTCIDSFADDTYYDGQLVIFDKRAQLGPATIIGRFGNTGLGRFHDINELTVFADYELPKSLRAMGVIEYAPHLAKIVDNQELVEKDSQEEVEIRAATIHAAKRIQDRINSLRTDNPVNALHIDYKLWESGRTYKDSKHHLTRTIAY